jgi:hypothetical protein
MPSTFSNKMPVRCDQTNNILARHIMSAHSKTLHLAPNTLGIQSAMRSATSYAVSPASDGQYRLDPSGGVEFRRLIAVQMELDIARQQLDRIFTEHQVLQQSYNMLQNATPHKRGAMCTYCLRDDFEDDAQTLQHRQSGSCGSPKIFKILYAMLILNCDDHRVAQSMSEFDKHYHQRDAYDVIALEIATKSIPLDAQTHFARQAWVRWLGTAPNLRALWNELEGFYFLSRRLPSLIYRPENRCIAEAASTQTIGNDYQHTSRSDSIPANPPTYPSTQMSGRDIMDYTCMCKVCYTITRGPSMIYEMARHWKDKHLDLDAGDLTVPCMAKGCKSRFSGYTIGDQVRVHMQDVHGRHIPQFFTCRAGTCKEYYSTRRGLAVHTAAKHTVSSAPHE